MPDHYDALAEATLRRCAQTRERAREALRRLDHDGTPITFVAVAQAADVSRALLYRDPALRAEVERLRDQTITNKPRLPSAQRATEASLRRRVETLLDDVHVLRAENHDLKEHLAAVLGEQRANRLVTSR